MWKTSDPTTTPSSVAGWADSDALLGAILGALTLGLALAGVGLYAGASGPPVDSGPRSEVRPVSASLRGETGGGQVRVALIGAGPVPLSQIAPVGAFDAASGVLVSSASGAPDRRAAISATETEWLSVPEAADYRRGSGRPSTRRTRELEAPSMPGSVTSNRASVGVEAPSIVPYGPVQAPPSWLELLPIPFDPARRSSPSFGPET